MRLISIVRATSLTFLFVSIPSFAQLVDRTRAPHTENKAAIEKSLSQEIGAGRGNLTTPNSSIFLINRDPFRSIRRGRQIFQRKFALEQGLGPITGDGAGDIEQDDRIGAGLSDSCAGCHGRPRGSAGHGGNVATRPDSRDAPHLFGVGLVEMLADEMTTQLRKIKASAIADAASTNQTVTRNLVARGVNFGTFTAFPNGTFDESQIQGVDTDLRVKPFFAEGLSFSLREFAVGAFNAEMGLEAPDTDLLAAHNGSVVTTPSGMVLNGNLDEFPEPPAQTTGADPDLDGVTNEIDIALVDHMEFYLLNYFRPAFAQQTSVAQEGRVLFNEIGCTSCHIDNGGAEDTRLTIGNDRRVFDASTAFDAAQGIFNRLFSTYTALFTSSSDGTTYPPIKTPLKGSFKVVLFSDLKRHNLGPAFWERQYDGSIHKEFVTEPLWGVGSTAPYGHDGRSVNLDEVIRRHGGEALAARQAYNSLSALDGMKVIAFLQSLVLFPPDDTASTLDPGNPSDPDFPQRGHGAIDLSVLFNNPSNKE